MRGSSRKIWGQSKGSELKKKGSGPIFKKKGSGPILLKIGPDPFFYSDPYAGTVRSLAQLRNAAILSARITDMGYVRLTAASTSACATD